MIILQLINLFFIVMVSARLVKQLKKHRVSTVSLAQSYVSTLLLFAGLYTLTYRLQPRSWKFIEEELETDPILVIVLYSKFLFFSVSTATLCGMRFLEGLIVMTVQIEEGGQESAEGGQNPATLSHAVPS
ncbi:uncharacterized protein LOC143302004 [Babylonia areolata]|uniref:uncharacterized protein LOC143302004 n=1 Tax=Babylonia areolata TaxID=304850 RepID=UPI003FCFBA4F